MVSPKNIIKFNFVVFGIIGLIHLIRLLTQFEIIVEGYTVSLWFNLIFLILAGWLAYENYKIFSGKRK